MPCRWRPPSSASVSDEGVSRVLRQRAASHDFSFELPGTSTHGPLVDNVGPATMLDIPDTPRRELHESGRGAHAAASDLRVGCARDVPPPALTAAPGMMS